MFEELSLGHNHLYPVDINREDTETARKNRSFVERLTKISSYVYVHPNEVLDVSAFLKNKDIRELTEKNLSFKEFGYGMSSEEIESKLGEPSQGGFNTYYNGVGVIYFGGQAKVIQCISEHILQPAELKSATVSKERLPYTVNQMFVYLKKIHWSWNTMST